MACSAGPNTVEDGLILNIDPINLEKNLTTNTSTNFLQNGSFSGGLGVTYEAGSNPTNTIIELENPGESQYVLRQNGNNTEYQMNIDGGAQGTLSASTQYVMSGWYATSDDYNASDTMFHARAYSTGGSHNATGNGIGTLLYSKVVGGLTWEFRYQTITTPSDYSGNFDWFMGYGTNNSAGYRYYTGLKVEEGSFPSALDLSRNGNEGKVKGATFSSDGYFDFDGSDDYIDCGNSSILDVGNNITVNVWFYVDSTSSYRAIVAKVLNDYSLGWEVANSSGTFRVTLRPSATQVNLVAGTLSVGNWYMGTMTFDNTTARLYLNGVQTGSTTSGGPVTLNSTQSLTIGRRIQGSYHDGNIAQVSIYNRALTASEISQNFNALRGRFGI